MNDDDLFAELGATTAKTPTLDDTLPLPAAEQEPGADGDVTPVTRIPRPRIRWASIVWGALFAVFGVTVLTTTASADRRGAFADWLFGLGAGGWTVVGVLALGALLLVLGLIAALRALTVPRSSR